MVLILRAKGTEGTCVFGCDTPECAGKYRLIVKPDDNRPEEDFRCPGCGERMDVQIEGLPEDRLAVWEEERASV